MGERRRGRGGEDLCVGRAARLFMAHPLTYFARFASSPIQLPQLVTDRAKSVIPDVSTLHLADSAHETHVGAPLELSPIGARKRSRHQLTIPLHPINSLRLGTDSDPFLTAAMPGLYVQYLSWGAELLELVCGGWVLGGDGGELGVKNLWKRTGKPPPGADGKALTAVRERSQLQGVLTGPITVKEEVLKLLNDTLFIPGMPDIRCENLHNKKKIPSIVAD
ncbi:hypothetical protein HOY80DRAFT_1094961 [Tuber brumale]|nr:hypothetical protein HOY80DRAFT_1094961 [Tuber brumale]